MRIKVNEIGRSMVEMLGVLAIIGVLSVAGVGTYQYALTAYQAGKIQDVLGKAKTLAQTDSRASHALEVNRFIKSALPEYAPDDKKAMVSLADGKYHVTAFKLPYKICEKLLQKESVLNDMGISILTRMCGNKNSKTSMVFAFEATPVVESGSHFNGGSGEGTGGSGGNNPETCPDKQVWRQKEDGTYGCVCRHDYEYGEDCTRCEPPRSWNNGNQSCQCPANRPIWENGTCKCTADTDCQYSGTGFCCDETEQICRQCVDTDCDTTKGLTLADGRCACSGRKEWRQDEGDSEPSCKCPVNTPAEANPETCECPDGKDSVDEDGDGVNECITSCPSDTGFTGLRNRTTGNCLCDTSKGYKAESETVNGVQMCVCDSSKDYYPWGTSCKQCVRTTVEWCKNRYTSGYGSYLGYDCEHIEEDVWSCDMHKIEGNKRYHYNPSTKQYCDVWHVLKKDASGNFYCTKCDDNPTYGSGSSLEFVSKEYGVGYCLCTNGRVKDEKTGYCKRKCAAGQHYYASTGECSSCPASQIATGNTCLHHVNSPNSYCWNGIHPDEVGGGYFVWTRWYGKTPAECHNTIQPSLSETDKCSYKYGCMIQKQSLPYCSFNTKITTDCRCSTNGNVGQYCCSASTYPTSTGCSSCPTGQTPNSSRTGCESCPKNTITQNGKCVKCQKGYYPSSQQNRCLACPSDRTTDEDGLTCSVCIDSNKIFNMITNRCECPPEISFEDPINGSCIFFEDENTENMEEQPVNE